MFTIKKMQNYIDDERHPVSLIPCSFREIPNTTCIAISGEAQLPAWGSGAKVSPLGKGDVLWMSPGFIVKEL